MLGFLALAALRSAEVIGAGLGERLGDAAAWFILLAVAGLGLSVPMRDLTGADLRPIAVGGITAAVLAAVALGAAVIVGGTL